ncbi:MAG: 16S rRNA (uracil(1498)-N(3))-methyltransferase [Bdellovibrionaceae bacterium]|nr:16S rRNA (uracil(1498)-N(3))-methyltransferase [Pseudobdellovibrionaceae bacterium]
MNLISLNEADFLSFNCVRLEDRRFAHIKNVLKVEKGKKLRVGLIGGKMGWGQVLNITSRQVELEVELNEVPPMPASVELIIALPRPKSLPRIVQSLTTLGIKRVIFLNTWKVEKCYWSSDYLNTKSLDQAVLLGLEQAVDTVLPKIEFHRLFKPFIEDHLDNWCSSKERILCHLPARKAKDSSFFVDPKTNPDSSYALAIGPEGGFIDYEVQKFLDQGFKLYSLGQRVLKLETAIPALVSRFTQTYRC